MRGEFARPRRTQGAPGGRLSRISPLPDRPAPPLRSAAPQSSPAVRATSSRDFQGFDKAVRRAVLGTVRRAIRGAVPADQRLFGHGHAGQKVPPAPSGSARKKGTGGEGASGNLGMLRARPHATRIMRENTPSRRLIAARRRRSSRRLFPPNVRRSPNCGLWRQVQAERRAIAPRPETPALSLPERLSITYTRRKEFVGRRFVPRGDAPLRSRRAA